MSQRTIPSHPVRRAAVEQDLRRERMGLSRAELARRGGRVTPTEHNYLSAVLRGDRTSAPVVEEVRELLDALEAERAEAGEVAG